MMHYFLGMEVWQNLPGTREVCSRDPEEVQDDGLQGHDHTHGIEPEATKCCSSESVDAMMYRQMIGSLMYPTNTRPDICFIVNTLRHVHLMVAKHAVRYLKGTVEYGLKYDTNLKINLEDYVDLDWAYNTTNRKSTSWCSRKQSYVGTEYSQGKICFHLLFGR